MPITPEYWRPRVLVISGQLEMCQTSKNPYRKLDEVALIKYKNWLISMQKKCERKPVVALAETTDAVLLDSTPVENARSQS